MHFDTTAGVFAQAVSAGELAGRGGDNGSVRLVADGDVVVIGSDGETSVAARCAATVHSSGSVIVVGRALAAYCSGLESDAPLVVRLEGGRLVVRGNGRVYHFATFEGTYSQVDSAGDDGVAVGAQMITRLYSAVRHAVDPRTSLVKLTIGDGRAVMYATDSYRLASASTPLAGGPTSILIPTTGLSLALRQAPETLCVDQRGRVATFTSPYISTTVRLGAAAFPAVETVLVDEETNACDVERSALERALGRLASVAGSEPLRCRIREGLIDVTVASGEGAGGERIAGGTVEGTGREEVEFGISGKHLIDALSACGGKDVRIGYSSERRPIRVSSISSDVSIACIIMPVVWDA